MLICVCKNHEKAACKLLQAACLSHAVRYSDVERRDCRIKAIRRVCVFL